MSTAKQLSGDYAKSKNMNITKSKSSPASEKNPNCHMKKKEVAAKIIKDTLKNVAANLG